jgi:hypothetical protein
MIQLLLFVTVESVVVLLGLDRLAFAFLVLQLLAQMFNVFFLPVHQRIRDIKSDFKEQRNNANDKPFLLSSET